MMNMFFKRKKMIVSIDGINDDGEKRIEDVLEGLADVIKVKVYLNKKCIVITYVNTLDEVLVQNKLEDLGYVVTGIKEKM